MTLPSRCVSPGDVAQGKGPGLMLVELSVVEQRYHAVMEVPRWANRWSSVIPPHTPYGSPAARA